MWINIRLEAIMDEGSGITIQIDKGTIAAMFAA
jgi:hypothetical protein